MTCKIFLWLCFTNFFFTATLPFCKFYIPVALYKGSLEPVDEKTRPLNHVSKVHVGIHKPRGQPLGEGVCQMIILLHYLHSKSGHLGGGGLNFPKKWARGLWMASRVAQILRSCRGGPCQGAKFECGFKFLL